MASDVTRDDHDRLVARVDVLDGEVEGEKMVTRYILEQTRRNGDDLAAIKSRLERVESDVHLLKTDVAVLKTDLAGLRRELPDIVSGAVREVLRGQEGS